MFDFELSDEQQLIVETARSFATEALFPRLREHESARGVAAELRATYTEMGFAALELPESLGGAGLGAVARALLNEELAAGDAGAALALDPLGPALYPLLEMAGAELLREVALPLLDREGARAVLVCDGDAQLEVGETLSGCVPWAAADRVDLLVVLRGDELLVVREGIEASQVPGAGLRAAGASELRLDDAVIAWRVRDDAGARRALARARLYVASLLLGVLRQACEFSRDYAQQRSAFGRPIAHHQGLAFLITDMHAAVDGARLLLHEAAWRVDAALPCAEAAAVAFAEAVEAALLVGPNGVQILGGHGFMQDYPVEKYMREARVLGLLVGGADAAREDAGRGLAQTPGRAPLSHIEAS